MQNRSTCRFISLWVGETRITIFSFKIKAKSLMSYNSLKVSNSKNHLEVFKKLKELIPN